jgi:DNA-binding response OmpR family regulator
MRKQKVLVVEDDVGTARLIRLYLEKEGYIVEVSHGGLDGLDKAKHSNPDLIVLDLMLPDLDGMEICRRVRAESDVPIIMLTARVLESDRLQGFDKGADDYVTKPFSPRELVSRVRAVIRRCNNDSAVCPANVTRGKFTIDYERHEIKVEDKPLELTPSEFNLLSVMLLEPNRVFTRGDLIEKAFGMEYEAFERTLDVHILHLRRKIKEIEESADKCIDTVHGMGYRLKI